MLMLLIAGGVLLGLLAFWIVFAIVGAIRDNENLQAALCAILFGLGAWWWWEMGYKVFPIS
jgi:hypothetical protein